MSDDIWARSPYKNITHQMLLPAPVDRSMRQYVIDKIKAPMVKAVVILGRRYPYPTKENTTHPNTHRLLEIRDEFFKHETGTNRKDFFEALWRVFIDEYEHDAYYRDRIDWIREQIMKAEWKPRPLMHPEYMWNEPERPHSG